MENNRKNVEKFRVSRERENTKNMKGLTSDEEEVGEGWRSM